ncbi:MAG: acyl carrier protein [Lachnospiraceae bacterium]|nr:acyl carrier protein [Lachnospiraceae bacterium]
MLSKIAELMKKQLNIPAGIEIDEDTAFKDDLRLDSFEMMEFVMALEEEYGVGFSDEEVAELETVGDMMDAINEKGIELD